MVYAGVSPKAIAVQSPYVAQVQLLRDSLDEIPLARGVEIATIDSFQGREADAVIISMVCCTKYMLCKIVKVDKMAGQLGRVTRQNG